MRPLNACELLTVWDKGQGQSLPECAQVLLDAAKIETYEPAAQLSIGQRDRQLLRLRELTFGSQLVGNVACPDCNVRLELNFNVSDVLVVPADESVSVEGQTESYGLSVGDYEVQFRLPTNEDLIAVADQTDEQAAQRALFDRCLIAVNRDGQPTHSRMPAEVTDRIVQSMETMDRQANSLFALKCPDCGNQWNAVFDILSFFWHEIGSWARIVLNDVHVLAMAYGWTESEILSLSAARRRRYREMICE